jgi:hypothetical protein
VGNFSVKESGGMYPKAQTIGHERYYETMAFKAKYKEPYWEADVSREISLDSKWSINECEHETDLKADAMHEAVVSEITAKLIEGKLP